MSTAAALITTAGYVPQACRTIRTRSTARLSLPAHALLLLLLGTTRWAAYGLAAGNWPLLISNGIMAVLAGIILALKLLARPGVQVVTEE